MHPNNETQTRLEAETSLIPPWAWALAIIAFVIAQVFFNYFLWRWAFAPVWGRLLMGLLAGAMLGGYFLLLGYLTRDARRRGMSVALWVLIAILIPNGFGILLYFILRQPRLSLCPQCGNPIQAGYHFCPRCSHKLSPTCPHCQRLVGANDIYCLHCGTAVHSAAPFPPV